MAKTEQQTGAAVEPQATAEGKRRRPSKIVLAALALVVLLAGFTVLFAGRSNDDLGATMQGIDPTIAALPQPTAVPGQPESEPSARPSAPPLVFRGVDPFVPLVKADNGQGGSEGGQTGGPAPEAPEEPEGPSSAVVAGKVVTLVDIFTEGGKRKAHVDVEGTVYVATPGDNFLDDYALIAFDGSCAKFAWRDQSFRLCSSA